MPHRLSVVVDLVAPVASAPGQTRAEWLAARRSATHAVKQKVLARIEQLRALDPEVEVQGQSSLFPVLFVRSTPALLDALSEAPEVVGITPEQEGELLQTAPASPPTPPFSQEHASGEPGATTRAHKSGRR
jgi:hypothetical protein